MRTEDARLDEAGTSEDMHCPNPNCLFKIREFDGAGNQPEDGAISYLRGAMSIMPAR